MKKKSSNANTSQLPMLQRSDGMLVGKIVNIDEQGQIWVDFPDNPNGASLARITHAIQEQISRGMNLLNEDVVIYFEKGHTDMPVVLDRLLLKVEKQPRPAPQQVELQVTNPEDATIDGKKVHFAAEEQMVLRCGRASITLTRAGKVIIRGAYLSTRSSGAHVIKGSSVKIN